VQKLTFVLVLAALGVAGWQTWEASNLREDLATQSEEMLALRTDLDRVTRDLAARDGRPVPPPMRRAEAATPAAPVPDEPTLAPAGASPEVLARQLRDLQDEVAGMREDTARLEEKVGSQPAVRFKRPKFISNVEQARKELDLDGRQEADIQRIVDDTKRDLDDVWSIPNADGKTWNDISKTTIQGGDTGGGITIVMPNFAEQAKFRNSLIPGRNETYGQADERIRGRGVADVRNVLRPDQRKTFDEAQTQSLFGPTHAGPTFAISAISTALSEDD